jgi:hypothetical protein
MPEIPQVDLAWEAVSALAAWSDDKAFADAVGRALFAIEQAGGKDPAPQRMVNAAPDMLAELQRLYERHRDQSIADVIAKATGKSDAAAILVRPNAPPASTTEQGPKLTVAGLVRAFKEDPNSNYHSVRYATRRQYDGVLGRIEREIGALSISEIKPDDVRAWYNDWSANGQIAMAHTLVGHARMMLGYGSRAIQDADCSRLLGAMHGMHFKNIQPRKDRITAKQANDIRAKAHKMGRPSLALAQALQFELQLGQRDVIGEWVPKDEPGQSDVFTENEKWVRGLRWSQIDANLILRSVSGGPEIDLRQFPMVVEEIAKFQSPPSSGPILVCEASGLPWTAYEFRRQWRKVADAAGIPRSVKNMDSRARRSPSNSPPTDGNRKEDRERKDNFDRRLIGLVNAVLPTSLPEQVRADVKHDMIVGVLSGKIKEADVRKLVPKYISKHYKGYDNRFTTVSLDQPVAGMESGSLGDQISSDHDIWK